MSVFEAIAQTEPTSEQGAMQVKRTIAMAFRQVEDSLTRVKLIVDRHGSDKVLTSLGTDRTEVVALYRVLKDLVERHKPGATIPDVF